MRNVFRERVHVITNCTTTSERLRPKGEDRTGAGSVDLTTGTAHPEIIDYGVNMGVCTMVQQ